MKYALLIYEDGKYWDEVPKDEYGKMMDGYRVFGERNEAAIRDGAALQSTTSATTVRVRDGERVLTDGPFAETREQFGGYYVVEAAGLDEAIEMAAQIPGAVTGCVEVRPVLTFSEDGS